MNRFFNAKLIATISMFFTGNVLAATSILSGNYVASFTKTCQSTILNGSQIIPGDISTLLGSFNITPDNTGYAGNATFTGYNHVGHTIVLSTTDTDIMKEKQVNTSTTYSNDATTMFISVMDNNNGETFHIYYFNIDNNNVAHNAELISLTHDNNPSPVDPNYCTTRGSLQSSSINSAINSKKDKDNDKAQAEAHEHSDH